MCAEEPHPLGFLADAHGLESRSRSRRVNFQRRLMRYAGTCGAENHRPADEAASSGGRRCVRRPRNGKALDSPHRHVRMAVRAQSGAYSTACGGARPSSGDASPVVSVGVRHAAGSRPMTRSCVSHGHRCQRRERVRSLCRCRRSAAHVVGHARRWLSDRCQTLSVDNVRFRGGALHHSHAGPRVAAGGVGGLLHACARADTRAGGGCCYYLPHPFGMS